MSLLSGLWEDHDNVKLETTTSTASVATNSDEDWRSILSASRTPEFLEAASHYSKKDALLQRAFEGQRIPEAEVITICLEARTLMHSEPNIREISSPVTVIGDIHGQFSDLREILEMNGGGCDSNYLFLGDYVDRGFFSVECLLLVLILKVRFPDRVTLIRGNHESRQITQVYGFYDECLRKYGTAKVWHEFTAVFDAMPLAALINGNLFCPHAGLSPSFDSIDSVREVDRFCEVPHEGPVCDLLWSDPDDRMGWAVSPRGAGYTFGLDISQSFNETNGLDLVIRAHQLMMNGYKLDHGGQILTLFSAPNYCYRCGNSGATLSVSSSGNFQFSQYQPCPDRFTADNFNSTNIVLDVTDGLPDEMLSTFALT